MAQEQPSNKDEDVAAGNRSPSFPFISLKKAIKRAEEMAAKHHRSPARVITVADTWKYGKKSSGLLRTVAALKQFGLIEESGSGDDKKIHLSELGWRILKDDRPGKREEAIKEAAMKPRLIVEYASQWLPERPSNSHCVSELHLDRGFSEAAAKRFINVFDHTVSFAKLSNVDRMSPSLANDDFSDDEDDESLMEPKEPKTLQPQTQTPQRQQPPEVVMRSVPISVSFTGDTLQVSATLTDAASVDKLIKALEANKPLLQS